MIDWWQLINQNWSGFLSHKVLSDGPSCDGILSGALYSPGSSGQGACCKGGDARVVNVTNVFLPNPTQKLRFVKNVYMPVIPYLYLYT